MDHQAKTLKGSRERAVRGHGKKLADGRRGRKLTRAMENWAKPRTWHTPRTRTLTRTRERVRESGKKMAHTPCEPAQNQLMMVNKRCHGSENMSHGKKTLPRQRLKTVYPSFTN